MSVVAWRRTMNDLLGLVVFCIVVAAGAVFVGAMIGALIDRVMK